MTERICPRPWERLATHVDGRANTCCPIWLDPSAIAHGSHLPTEQWNAPAIVELRRNLLAENYSKCANCPELGAGYARRADPAGLVAISPTPPRELTIAFDLSCNLSCWSCRSESIMATPDQIRQQREALANLAEWRETLERVSLLHSGELFTSRPCIEWLRTLTPAEWPRLTLELFTNGTLLARRWTTLQNAHPFVRRFIISTDAATQRTYESIRRGGQWLDLLAGLQLVKGLRDAGQLADGFQLNFVVQPDNLDDVPLMLEFAREHNVTCIMFGMLEPTWMAADSDLYAAVNLSRPDHPLRAKFVQVAEHLAAQHRASGAPEIIAHTVWKSAFDQWELTT